jgi:hypothetical protein
MEVRSGFLNARKSDSFIRVFVVLNGRDIDFSGPAIHRTGIIHLIVRVFEVSGERILGGIDQTLRIDLNEEGYERTLKYGLIYTALLPALNPGPYQVRAACRDQTTGKVGTAGDFVMVPRVEKALALSGIVFRNLSGVENHVRPAAGPLDYAAGERAQFALQILNGGGAPLTMRAGLSATAPRSTKARKSRAPGAIPAFATTAIQIPADLPPGDYLMRVEVEDRVPPPHHGKAWQWARLAIAAPRQ